MVPDRLQEHLDALVADIGYGATVEDLDGRAIAYSAQPTPIDEARMLAILTRETPPDVYDWQQSHGIATADKPVRIPANPELKMHPRLCIPLRYRGVRLGHLWIIESDRPCTADEVATAERRARGLAALLYRDRSPALAAWTETSALLARGLGGDRRAGARALRRLSDEHGIPPRAPLRVLAVVPTALDGAGRSETLAQMHVALADRFAARSRDRLAAVVGGHLAVLAVDGRGAPGALSGDADAVLVAARLRDEMLQAVGGAIGVAVGISDRHGELADVSSAHEQACRAAQASAVDPTIGPVASWSQIGIYRLLMAGGMQAVAPDIAAPALERLGGGRDAQALRDTLETYLDLGGNVQRTAAVLHLHRTSLYHRLGRIEERAGVDLGAGHVRLELHVALKLARLADAPAL
ncbi:PucR family transcriptional regulator [Capillimicrobium parvum]|uniref:Proline-responsive transcriptional activator PutR n=1 Tax=Capillimicrobium parvum TaxID=2884022 RepID=A0A9E6XXL0_9ACTN|nr:PucR family transcriptional regulator [Capillimicrobium parvum]UGS35661.1 Proline-responsive transcriptional activator PutR [Capillimicrobium parvum]